MRLHYISFFYFNIILLFFLIFKFDIIFLILLFCRKTYSVYKESILNYTFQEFDVITIETQTLDLEENCLYADFSMEAVLEEAFLFETFIYYSFYDISLDYELYTGNYTFKWDDESVEELNLNLTRGINFKKIYLKNYLPNYYYNNLKEKSISRDVDDDDYTYLYNYKKLNRREMEDLIVKEENEKYYYNYLKIFFIKENYYEIFLKDNYFWLLNYNKFIDDLKQRVHINKKENYKKKIRLNELFFFTEFNDNLKKIKIDIINDNYFEK